MGMDGSDRRSATGEAKALPDLLNGKELAAHPLRVGLSMEASIDTRDGK